MGVPPVLSPVSVTYPEALRVWCRVALLSFGGPAGQIAVMHRILVDEKRWVDEGRFLHALNYCMLLPGPEAQQLATYIGWLLHGTRGALTAGLLFILPGFLSILALSIVYAEFHDLTFVEGLFFGLKAAVLAVVVEAVIRIGKKALKNNVMVAVAALSFIGIFFFKLPFPIIVGIAALLGLIGGRLRPDLFHIIKGHTAPADASAAPTTVIGDHHVFQRPRWQRTVLVAAIWLTVWLAPVLGLRATFGPDHVLSQEAVFFSKAATITFGGAYAVLGYIAQEAVEEQGWLEPEEMLDGLGMAETTPGPLIQVVQFVGFLGAYRQPQPFTPLTAAVLGSIVTTWVTFAPCFLWIMVGAPYIEALRGNRLLSSALSTITAAVVGVILNLAVWFALHTLFERVSERAYGPLRLSIPDPASLDLLALAITIAAFLALFRFKVGMIPTILGAGAIGVVLFLLT